MNYLLKSPFGDVPRHFNNIARNTAFLAQANAPVNTGTLVSNIKHQTNIKGYSIVARAGVLRPVPEPVRPFDTILVRPSTKARRSAPNRPTAAGVLVMQTQGHGPIRPVRKKALVFDFKLGAHPFFSRGTRGYKPNPFLINAFRTACPYPITVERI